MTVPIHNLYDFVHQQLENRFMLAYFYPFGQKLFENIISQQHQYKEIFSVDNIMDLPDEVRLADESNTVYKILPKHLVDSNAIGTFAPWVLCHDQEPLQYDFYTQNSHTSEYIERKKPKNTPHDRNLRWFWPTNCRSKWLLLHSELNSIELDKYEQTENFVGAYWWSHAFLARDWYRFAEHDKFLRPGSRLDKTFLLYCRETNGLRTYRKKLLDQLNFYAISDCQFGSFTYKEVSSTSSAEYTAEDFNRTAISLVAETCYDERIHLTEKTLRPIACGHPFILFAGPGSLDYLKSYGFKTFSPYINEQYDSIIDNEHRMTMIMQEIKRIENLPQHERHSLTTECNRIAKHNKSIFFSRDFYTQIVDELVENVKSVSHEIQSDFSDLFERKKHQKLNQRITYYANPTRMYFIALQRHIKKGGTLENYVPPWEN